ncbi:MAG: ATP synthase F1 subunit gamma [Candidatus Omnitrophica bacterium]|nr:ATP synthase F1 subunit gamma [Candidatus Omnitrophota bacterium]MDE2213890.1 ATP synthase F1 subunit gamma [Candidatus Omnitrophota bacterium]MDE2231851.1 ATP synthase F1 subunit gamma [Candidatus Omnitrophota bacterium]
MIGIREFNKKIASLKNTRKMTKTMKMVSASKFKRAHKAQESAQDYAQKLGKLMESLSGAGPTNHPLLKTKRAVTRSLIVLFTSDKGLCGGFNNNLIRKTRHWISDNPYKYTVIGMSFCGRRGYMAFRRSAKISKYYENITAKPEFEGALKVAQEVTDSFINSEYEEIYLAYNRFDGAMTQTPVIEKILPLDASVFSKSEAPLKSKGPRSMDYTYEPEEKEILYFLIPKFLNFKIFYTLLENAAGEHGARMTAMDKASQNTGELIDRYTLLRNRARQAAITNELIEIISGAEALK